jgi:hypothetical protein
MDVHFAIWLGTLAFVAACWLLALSTMGRAAQFDADGLVFKPLVGRAAAFSWRAFERPAMHSIGPLPRVVLKRVDRRFWSLHQSVVVLLDGSSYSSDFLSAVASKLGVTARSA